MGKSGIETLLYMMDMAFEGDPASEHGNWHALLVNLGSVRDADWRWLPQDGRRSIFTLARDIGECKYVYACHVAGDCSMHWDRPDALPPTIGDEATPGQVIAFLREAQTYLRDRVEALSDDRDLLRVQMSPQEDQREVRWMIKTMIEHDVYHAGEINHIRALVQGND